MVYLMLADGFEEIEALTPLDILRRAQIEVKTIGVTGKTVTGAHSIPVVADILLDDIVLEDMSAVILPGGMPGTLNLEKSANVQSFIDYAVENNLIIGAICAAPSILGHKGILQGKTAVCYDGFETQLFGAKIGSTAVCRDGNIITAVGAGAALQFGLELTKAFSGDAQSNKIKESMKCTQ